MSTNSSSLSYGLGQESPRSTMETHLSAKVVLLQAEKVYGIPTEIKKQ